MVYYYYFIYLYLLFVAIFIIVTLIGGIYAFLADKSWATATLLFSVVAFALSLVSMFYGLFNRVGMNNSEGLFKLLTTISPLLFLIGLFGFVIRSKKIHSRTESLLIEKQTLENKLTELNALVKRKAYYNQQSNNQQSQ